MRNVGAESRKTYQDKLNNGFFEKYMSGNGLEIGGKGYEEGIVPILETATNIEVDFPGYDGINLPFPDESQDYVYSSHCLEHISDYKTVIKEWYRVLKNGGHIVIVVPHQFLYEKRKNLSSKWNGDHKRFYSPASLLNEIEQSLNPNTYRVKLLEDGDKDFNYEVPPDQHSHGQYEITLVIQKIKKPNWDLA